MEVAVSPIARLNVGWLVGWWIAVSSIARLNVGWLVGWWIAVSSIARLTCRLVGWLAETAV